MSPTAPPRATQTPTARYQTEPDFLADQAATARTAMSQTLQELKHTLARATDVRTCTRRHPWIVTGSAIAAGFVAGAVLLNRRTASGEKVPVPTEEGTPSEPAAHEPFPQRPGFVRSAVGTALTGIVQTLLQSFIAAAVVAAQSDPIANETTGEPLSDPNIFAADDLSQFTARPRQPR